jgi:hypothetical protein
MSVERRLREGLERSASAVQPDVGRRLPEAIIRGRRRRRARRASLIVGAVAALAVIGVAVPQVSSYVHRVQQPAVSHRPTLPPEPDAAIAGSYTMVLPASSRVIRANGMAGTWTLRRSGLDCVPGPGWPVHHQRVRERSSLRQRRGGVSLAAGEPDVGVHAGQRDMRAAPGSVQRAAVARHQMMARNLSASPGLCIGRSPR